MASNGFSQTQKVGDPILPCQQGNVFSAYCPQGGPPMTAYVNGQATKLSLTGPLIKNGHTLDQTTGALELEVGGQCRAIIPDLAQFEISKPEEVGLAIGTLSTNQETTPYQPKGRLMEYAIQTTTPVADNDDIYNLAIPPKLAALAPTQGVIDIETADEDTVRWLAVSIVTTLGRIDEATGVKALADATGNDIDFTLTGTAAVPLALELTDMLKNKSNRDFLREIFKDKTKISKVWTNSAGNPMVSFRGYAGLRDFLTSARYGVNSTKVSIISSAVRNSNQWAGTLKSVGGRIPIISYIIVGAIDTAQWLALPEAEQELSDLLAILFVDISKIGISTVIGAIGAAIIIGLSAPVWVVVTAGIGIAVSVGILLDIADNTWGITKVTKELAVKIGQTLEEKPAYELFIENVMSDYQ